MLSSLSSRQFLVPQQTGNASPVDEVAGMAAQRGTLHQPVFPVLPVQGESLPHQNGCGSPSEADTDPLIDTHHIEDANERCRTLSDETGVLLMQTSLSHSRLYRPLLSERRRGVCTLFPPHGGKLSRLCIELGNELHEILQRLCTE